MIAQPVSVIVAAYQSQGTVARAAASALAQPEVAEVIVVDDASADGTAAAAESVDDGSGRLSVLRQPANRGPSAARNRAIREGRAPLIAMLDADDFLVPGRFAHLLSRGSEWDVAFDNIAFVTETALPGFDVRQLRGFADAWRGIGFADFVAGNMARPGRARAELGFVKPLLSRLFLEQAGLGYDESLRLGEDYVLYARMLAAGARFRRTDRCGYVAVERAVSLSSRHGADDLAALLAADRALRGLPGLSDVERTVLDRHIDQLAAKLHYRRLLDRRTQYGLVSAGLAALAAPRRLPATAIAYARDKLRAVPTPDPLQPVRYLFG